MPTRKIPYYSKKMKAFKAPSLQEVITQFQVKGCFDDIEPEQFFAYYESNGWYVGRSKMKNWIAAVSGWLLRKQKFSKQNPTAHIMGGSSNSLSDSIIQQEIDDIKEGYARLKKESASREHPKYESPIKKRLQSIKPNEDEK